MTKNYVMRGIGCWVEAMRLRTLPVSTAGVVMGCALAVMAGGFARTPAALCFAFALLAQIASNFANEYFDYRDGLDKAGRDGPRRGVTEGDISPRAMLNATIGTLALACVAGCVLIYYGGWILLPVGIITAAGALAYSAGPYPLSRHALGEVAVVVFFGIVPVTMVYYIMCGSIGMPVVAASIGIGLMSANILIVNNYRDRDDDAAVGKTTLAVKFGPRVSLSLYLLNGVAGMALMIPIEMIIGTISIIPAAVYLLIHIMLWINLRHKTGAALNPLLGMTAANLLLFTLLILACVCL